MLIIIGAIFRVVAACTTNLGNDEVYYFTYALQPDWNHFDHPPMVGLFIRLFTFNLHWNNEFTMRLTAIIGAAINTWLIAQCGRLVKNEHAGFIAAILYTTSIYTCIISGVFILPDSPQVVFWLASVYAMLKIIKTNNGNNKRLIWLGILIGLATMCKVHGVFLWFGFGGYILFYQRKLLSNPYLYFAVLLTVCIVSPIVFWNVQNNFITWRFHSERVEIKNSGIDWDAFVTAVFGQIIYNNPLNIVLYIIAGMAIVKRKLFMNRQLLHLLLWCGIPIIVATTALSLFRDTLPHWSGPGFLSLMIISGVFIDEQITENNKKIYNSLLKINIGIIVFVFVAGIAAVQFYPETMSNKKPPHTGDGDLTLDMYGWKEIMPVFDSIRKNDIASGTMSANAPLVVNKWFPAGHLLFYVAYPLNIKTVAVGELNDLHKFVWLNEKEGYLPVGSDGYFIAPSNYYTNPATIYQNDFKTIYLVETIPQKRGGAIARYWYIYRLKGAKKELGEKKPNA
ncbi:MAG: glycosyltransferase family 39 protein [Chitinophagaceae bacterium]|nr:glycosyltransferase family 39 protein [Chitinophagaceae bacterium]